MDTQTTRLSRLKLSKDTTVGITIGLLVSLVVGGAAYGGTMQALRSDINANAKSIIELEKRVENTEAVSTDVRLELIKIRTQLDTLIERTGS